MSTDNDNGTEQADDAAPFEPQAAPRSDGFKAAPGSEKRNGDANASIQDAHLEVILDVPVTLAVEVGRTMMSIRDLLQLSPSSVVKLHRPAGEPMDIRVNGCRVARGEVVVVGGQFGVRITDVVSPEERVSTLK